MYSNGLQLGSCKVKRLFDVFLRNRKGMQHLAWHTEWACDCRKLPNCAHLCPDICHPNACPTATNCRKKVWQEASLFTQILYLLLNYAFSYFGLVVQVGSTLNTVICLDICGFMTGCGTMCMPATEERVAVLWGSSCTKRRGWLKRSSKRDSPTWMWPSALWSGVYATGCWTEGEGGVWGTQAAQTQRTWGHESHCASLIIFSTHSERDP